MPRKNKRPGYLVRIIPAKKGYWEIYAYVDKGVKKPVGFIGVNRKHYSGYFYFGTRLISPNGREVTGNKDFNSVKIAMANIKIVKLTA